MRLHGVAGTLAALVLVAGAGIVSATPEDACLSRFEVWIEEQRAACEADENCDPGRPALETLCPDLAAALAAHPLAPALARPVGNRTPADAAQIGEVQARYDSAQTGPRPDIERLPLVLSQMREPAPRRLSLREQFWRWLTHKLGLDEFELPEWAEKLSISPRVADAVFYGSIALLLILAVAVVVNELRQRRGGGRDRRAARWSHHAGQTAASPTLADVEAAPLSEQPRLLLAMVLHALSAKGAIDYRDSMTHRQLAAAADGLQQGEGLMLLSKAAERCTYGGWEPGPEDIDTLRRAGQGLLGSRPA